jgi:hypothetical protein
LGVYGEYFTNRNLVGPPAGAEIETAINFNWGPNTATLGLPPGIPTNTNWSARWTGQVFAPVSGLYSFQTTAEDGVRLTVGGALIIDRWRDQFPAQTYTGSISLVGGVYYSFRMEYYQNDGNASASLSWLVPGAGGYALVPTADLLAQIPPPTPSLTTGSFSQVITVTLAEDLPGTDVRYTLDGSATTLDGINPSPGSVSYTGPIVISATTTLNTQAFRVGTLITPSPVVQAVYTLTPTTAPRMTTVVALSNGLAAPTSTQIIVSFTEAVDPATSTTPGNYSIVAPSAIAIASATLLPDRESVLLVTASALASGTTYTLQVSGVQDPAGNPIRANSQKLFTYINRFPNSLTNLWRMDEGSGTTVADVVGGANGTLPANGPTWIPLGAELRALHFAGLEPSLMNTPNLQSVLGGTASLAAWIRTTANGNIPVRAPGIAGSVGTAASPANGFVSTGSDLFWGWLDETGRIGVTAGVTQDNINPIPTEPLVAQPGAQSTNPVNDGNWHHVVMTRDGVAGTVEIFVDGVLNAQANTVTTAPVGPNAATLGRITGALGTEGYQVGWLGDLDEIAVFNSILSPSQAQTLANKAPGVNAGGTLAVPPGALATNLNGVISDDGLPSPPTITSNWSLLLPAPGTVSFGNPASPATTATFSNIGVYFLRLTASDGLLSSSDDLVCAVGYGITVTPASVQTDTGGGGSSFLVFLSTQPAAGTSVSVTWTSNDTALGVLTTPGNPIPQASVTLIFNPANWNIAQQINVIGVMSGASGPNQGYSIVASPAQSQDPGFSGLVAPAVSVLNINLNPPPPAKQAWGHCAASVLVGPASGALLLVAAVLSIVAALLFGRRAP